MTASDLSRYCKASVLMYWKQKRGKKFVGTEVFSCGNSLADVMALGPDIAIETEIKITKEDFRRDFTSKTYKHNILKTKWQKPQDSMPHRFYFAVPSGLVLWAKSELNKMNSPYGLLEVVVNIDGSYLFGNTKVIRRAKSLHKFPMCKYLYENTLSRMASQLCHLLEEQALKGITKSGKENRETEKTEG